MSIQEIFTKIKKELNTRKNVLLLEIDKNLMGNINFLITNYLYADVNDVVDKLYDAVIVAIHVEECHGLVEHAQLAEYISLEKLIHSADATRHDDETIGHVFKNFIPFGHRFNHHELVNFVVADIHVNEVLGDDTDYLAFVFEHHVGDDLHQPYASSSIEQFALLVRQDFS